MLETEASRERWSVRFALFAVVLSAGALVVTFLQLKSSDKAVQVAERARQDAATEAERQRIDAQKTLDLERKDAAVALEMQTRRADRANALADRSAKAAEETARTAARQLEVANRPYVFLKQMDLTEPIVANKGTKISNIYENAGSTPAFDVKVLNTSQSIVDGSKPKFIFKTFTGSKAAIAPKGTFDASIVLEPMTPIQAAQVYAGARIIYVVGQITYSDIFNQIHQTQYCMMLDSKTGLMVGCPDQGKSY